MFKMNKKVLIILVLVGIIIFGVYARYVSLDKDISAEEGDFVNGAIALNNSGHPIFYNSELYPTMVFLHHPPMYIIMMSLVLKYSWINSIEINARIIHFVFSVLTSLMVFLFCYRLIGKEKGLFVGLISSSIFLISFFVLNSSIIIDIDILSSFFVFGFFYFMLRHFQTNNENNIYYAGIFMFFGLFNRYPMMILSYVFVGLLYYKNKDLKKNFKKYLEVGFISIIFFCLVWYFYTKYIEPGNLFSFLIHNSKLGSEQFSSVSIYISSFLLNIAQFIRLFTLPGVILLILSIAYFVRKRTLITDVLMLYFIPILLFFIVVPRPAFGYPRYFMTIFPGVSILIGMFFYSNFKDKDFNRNDYLLFIITFVLSFLLLIFLSPQTTFYESNGLIKATNLPDFLFNLFASIPLVSLFFVKDKKFMALLLILLALFLSYNLYFDYNLINHKSHIKETAMFIGNYSFNRDTIIVPKAIGFYANRKYHLNDNNKPVLDFSYSHLKKYTILSYNNREMNDSFFWPGGIYSGLYLPIPNNSTLAKSSIVVKYYPVESSNLLKKIGDFYIYRN